MRGWWDDSTVEVKYFAVVSRAGDPRSAVEPDHHAVDAGVQVAALAVIHTEGSSSASRLTAKSLNQRSALRDDAAISSR
jgi:hypothetical protein